MTLHDCSKDELIHFIQTECLVLDSRRLELTVYQYREDKYFRLLVDARERISNLYIQLAGLLPGISKSEDAIKQAREISEQIKREQAQAARYEQKYLQAQRRVDACLTR